MYVFVCVCVHLPQNVIGSNKINEKKKKNRKTSIHVHKKGQFIRQLKSCF